MSLKENRLERFKDWLYYKTLPEGSYEQWTLWRWIPFVLAIQIIFLLSPRWMMEVAGRAYRMIMAKIRDGNLQRFYREEAERELEQMKQGETNV